VTANLANFSYDPINYPFLLDAKAVDLFLQLLDSNNTRLVLHGIAGLCNLCLEPTFRNHIVNSGGISSIFRLLNRADVDIVANALTTLEFLIDETTRNLICTKDCEAKLQQLTLSSSRRIKNLAELLLEDHFIET
jgi:armadillo repeat-containing protein 7